MNKIRISFVLIALFSMTACAGLGSKQDTFFLQDIPWGQSYEKTIAQVGPPHDSQVTPQKSGIAEYKKQFNGVESLVTYIFYNDQLQMVSCDFADLSQYNGPPKDFASSLETNVAGIYGPSKHSMTKIIDPRKTGSVQKAKNVSLKPYNLYLKDWENEETHVLLLVNQDSDPSTFGKKSDRNFIWLEYRSKTIDPEGQVKKWRANFDKSK